MPKVINDYFSVADKICKHEFEKAFNFDLSLPVGHPKNRINVNNLQNILFFWVQFKEKIIKSKKRNILHKETEKICDKQITGILSLI